MCSWGWDSWSSGHMNLSIARVTVPAVMHPGLIAVQERSGPARPSRFRLRLRRTTHRIPFQRHGCCGRPGRLRANSGDYGNSFTASGDSKTLHSSLIPQTRIPGFPFHFSHPPLYTEALSDLPRPWQEFLSLTLALDSAEVPPPS